MGAVLTCDVGLSTGIALLYGPHMSTDTVSAADLTQYLYDVRETLAIQDVALDAVIAERPLTIWRSKLSHDLDALCSVIGTIFPQVQWIGPTEWKQMQEPLVRYARSRYLLAWKLAKTPHEKDALLISLWWQGVLAPAKSP